MSVATAIMHPSIESSSSSRDFYFAAASASALMSSPYSPETAMDSLANNQSYDQWQVWFRRSLTGRVRTRRSLLLDGVDRQSELGMRVPRKKQRANSVGNSHVVVIPSQGSQEQQQQQVVRNTSSSCSSSSSSSSCFFPNNHNNTFNTNARAPLSSVVGAREFCAVVGESAAPTKRQPAQQQQQQQQVVAAHAPFASLSRRRTSSISSSGNNTDTTSLSSPASRFGNSPSLVLQQEAILKQIQADNEMKLKQQQQRDEEARRQQRRQQQAERRASATVKSSNVGSKRVEILPESCVAQAKRQGEQTVLFECVACGQIMSIDKSIPIVYCPACGSLSRTDWQC